MVCFKKLYQTYVTPAEEIQTKEEGGAKEEAKEEEDAAAEDDEEKEDAAEDDDTKMDDGEEEDEDVLGMPTPTTELLSPLAINGVDLIVVPAAAVDRTGMRMGWGRGYFDKTLGSMQNCPPVYAVIFDDERLDSVPSERHDQSVDGVVTPRGIVAF